MRIEVLGKYLLTSNGASVTPPAGQVGDLFRVLLVRPGDAHPAGELCEWLWPGSPPEVAKPRLHVTVSRLRNFLDRHHSRSDSLRIDYDGDGYRLIASRETLDRVEFEELGVKALADGDVVTMEEALALWDGEPYTGFEPSDAVDDQRARLSGLHRSLVESKLRLAGADGLDTGFPRAKFRIPQLPVDSLLSRTRLLESTPDVGDVTVLSVTAPAGFGKSVFLAQWAQHQSVPVVWVGLDEDDNDPARFWSGVVNAIVETGRIDLELFTSEMRAGSAAFLDAVCEVVESTGAPVALVLDDFHLIENPSVVEQVSSFISALSEPATIAFGSRTELRFPTARLGASGRLHEVKASELRFTVEEVESVVGERSRAKTLWEATEGWPVAVMALRAAEVPTATSPMSMDMGDYLVEEVLGTVPLEVERFLMEVAYLDWFNRRLCDAVLGRQNTAEIIAWLEAHQFFVFESGSGGGWLRLHQLIRNELRRRAEVVGTVDSTSIHRRAAEWFLDQGMKEESLRYAVRAGEASLVVPTAGQVLVETALRQEAQACVRWLDLIEPDDLADDPRSHSIAVGLASVWGSAESRRRWALSRRRHFGGDEDVVLMFHDGMVAMNEGRSTEAVDLFERVINEAGKYAAEVAADLVGLLVGMAFSNLVQAKMFQGVLAAEDDLFSSAIGLTRPAAPAVTTFTQSYWVLVALVDGSYHLAGSLAKEYYEGRRHSDLSRRPTPDNSVVGALVAAQKSTGGDEFRRLAEGIEDLVDLYEWFGAQTWVALTRLVIAALHRAGGELGEASNQQRRADTLLRTLPDVPFLERFAASVDEIVAGHSPEGHGFVGILAPREREVLAYLTTDMTNEQIARALYVSPSTVHSQVSSIYRKLGVKSRHRAVLKVGIDNIDLTLIETPAEDR